MREKLTEETRAFFVVDLRSKWSRNPYITLWRPNSAGYAYPLPWAGRYTTDEIEAAGDYHTQRRYVAGKGHVGVWERFAVACEEIERLATPPDPVGRHSIDGNVGPVVRNSADMRAHLRRVRYVLQGASAARPARSTLLAQTEASDGR